MKIVVNGHNFYTIFYQFEIRIKLNCVKIFLTGPVEENSVKVGTAEIIFKFGLLKADTQKLCLFKYNFKKITIHLCFVSFGEY